MVYLREENAKLRGFMGYVGHMGPWVCGFVGEVSQEVRCLKRSRGSNIFWHGFKIWREPKI